jgi:hypothetical protein
MFVETDQYIVKSVLLPDEPLPTTAVEWVERFCYGGLKFRYVSSL